MRSDETEAGSGSVRAVTRALEILLAFDGSDGLTAADLLARVDLSKPTLYRLLYTLESLEFIKSEGDPQRFRLGPSVGRLARNWLCDLDIEKSAIPLMRRVWEQTQETVAIYIREDRRRVCMYEIASPQPLSFKRGVGHQDLLWKGASGKAILAAMRLSSQALADFVADPSCDLESLSRDLQAISSRGYGFSQSEMISGAVAVAAPFFDRTHQVAGSLVVFGPDARMDLRKVEEIGALLKLSGEELSRLLGSTATLQTPGDARSETAASRSARSARKQITQT